MNRLTPLSFVKIARNDPDAGFEAKFQRVAHGVWDLESRPRWVEERKGDILRFHEPLMQFPPIGSILNSKGPKGENCYAPAFHAIASQNIRFEGVTIRHALGMGFLAERCENVTVSDCGILFRGETYFWFESGAVEDVSIRNNHFEYCAYSAFEHAVLFVTPRSGASFDQTELYDRNIRFENNHIETFDNRIV